MKHDKQPPKNTRKDNEEFPSPQEQVADPFVEGTELGEIEEEREPELPEEHILESEDEDSSL